MEKMGGELHEIREEKKGNLMRKELRGLPLMVFWQFLNPEV